jgi:hypothetical protein
VTLNGAVFSSGGTTTATTGTTATFVVSNATASTGTNSGALQVVGGVGIGGNLNVGGIVTATNLYVGPYAVSTASALAVQYNGSALGTAGTLNFSTGTTATLNSGVLTIQATGGSSTAGTVSEFVWVMDGGGSQLSISDKAVIVVPFNCYVNQATVLGDTVGSALIYVSTSSVSAWNSRTLISSSSISLTNSRTLQISTGSWSNTVLSSGTLILASLQSVSTFTFLTLNIQVIKS